MTNKAVTFETGPLVDELAELSANARSVRVGIAQMLAMGRLGALVKELQRLADDMERAHTPRARQADAARFEKAAAPTTDRKLARYSRARAKRRRS